MAKFLVMLTRDTTESALVEVEAPDELHAHEFALARANAATFATDDENIPQPAYVTNCEEISA